MKISKTKTLDGIMNVYEAVQNLENLNLTLEEKTIFCQKNGINMSSLNWFIVVDSIERAKKRGDNPFFTNRQSISNPQLE